MSIDLVYKEKKCLVEWFFCNLVEEASLYLYRFLYKEVYETLSKMALPDCAKY